MVGGQILRDYLYLDVDKVKSIAGKPEYGVPEETRPVNLGDGGQGGGFLGV